MASSAESFTQAYFDYPASKMISDGITGTKGKSTTTYMIRDIIEKSGKTCGIVGTIGVAIARQGDTDGAYNAGIL